MIVISDCSKDIVIPAGLGNNPGVIYDVAGVKSLNGETGDVKIKTVNGQSLMGEGDVPVDVGVETLNGQKGALTLKTVNGNELTGDGNIEIQAGVESVNGETGAVKIKSVNGNDMLGEGNVAIDTGVESLNGQKGALTLKTVNGTEMLGEGNVAIDTGVESLNGQKGALTLKTVNGNDMLGEGNVTIDTGVESLNGQKGALTLKTVNGNELTGDGNIEIKAGVESVNGETGNVIVKSLKYKEVNNTTKKEVYADVKAHWSNESGYTGDYVYYFMRNGDEILFSRFKINDYALIMTAVLPENIDLTINGEVVLVSCIVFSDESQNVEFRYNKFAIPTNVSQLTNDSNYQTKTEVDTAIENAVSGAGSDNVIVLDGLSQEEVKAIYDKLDKTKVPNTVFIYQNSSSFRTYWDGDSLHFNTLHEEYSGLVAKDIELRNDGSIGNHDAILKYTNTLTLNVGVHVDEGTDFECGYSGSYYEYMVRPYNRPNSHFISLDKGIGDITTPIYVPVSVYLGNENYNRTTPVRIQFTANEKLYTYLHDSNQENKWLFESAKPIGGVQSSEVSNIKVLTQSEYDALTTKDENVLYCIKG